MVEYGAKRKYNQYIFINLLPCTSIQTLGIQNRIKWIACRYGRV